MFIKSIIKNLSFISRIASSMLIVFSLTIGNSAFAQPVFEDGLLYGLTTFYPNPTQQTEAVISLGGTDQNKNTTQYKNPECPAFKSGIVIPFSNPDTKYLGQCAGDGSFQVGDLDFSASTPAILGTNTRIQLSTSPRKEGDKIITPKIYAVVAGTAEPKTCPVAITDTQVAFFKTKDEAANISEYLNKKNYIVYVSPNPKVQAESLKNIKCDVPVGQLLVSGITKKVTVDFRDVYELLPSDLQQTAKNSVFTYTPQKGSDYIYLLNARAKYGSKD